MDRFEEIYYEAKDDERFRRFVIFCRIALTCRSTLLFQGFELS